MWFHFRLEFSGLVIWLRCGCDIFIIFILRRPTWGDFFPRRWSHDKKATATVSREKNLLAMWGATAWVMRCRAYLYKWGACQETPWRAELLWSISFFFLSDDAPIPQGGPGILFCSMRRMRVGSASNAFFWGINAKPKEFIIHLDYKSEK